MGCGLSVLFMLASLSHVWHWQVQPAKPDYRSLSFTVYILAAIHVQSRSNRWNACSCSLHPIVNWNVMCVIDFTDYKSTLALVVWNELTLSHSHILSLCTIQMSPSHFWWKFMSTSITLSLQLSKTCYVSHTNSSHESVRLRLAIFQLLILDY